MTDGAHTKSTLASYKVDPSHSRVGFSIRHMMSRVEGEFKEFSGTILFDPKTMAFQPTHVEIKAASIDTGNSQRDDHLRAADFLDVERMPTLKATTGSVSNVVGTRFRWTTDLTIHGVTKATPFEVEYLGATKDPSGRERIGFRSKAKVDRKDFGLVWSQAVEAGGLVVSSEVDISIDLEAVKA